MQDLVALVIVAVTAAWLVRTLRHRLTAPPCRPPVPGGGDGFVPLDTLRSPHRPRDGH